MSSLTEKLLTLPPGIAGLRVLFAVDCLFPGSGGAENQAIKLATALRERGAQIEFIAPQINGQLPLQEQMDGFTVRRIAYPQVPKFGALVLIARFRQFLLDNADRYDAIHVHITHLLAAAAGFARKKLPLPVVTKISGFYEFEGGVLDQSRRFNPVNFLVRRGLAHIDYVQAISQQTHQKLLFAGIDESRIRQIPNGIETSAKANARLRDEWLRIGFCGRLRQVKGLHVLLSAFASIRQSRPDLPIRLIIAGDGDALESLQQQAQTLELTDRIEWLGRIDDTAAFYESLDIYVQPSFAEGMPNSVMEAMLAQRAVVASDIGGNSDLLTHQSNGLLFPVGDSAALASAMVQLLDNPDLSAAIARAAQERIVADFGFEQITTQLAELYRGRG
ncbi:MAG: glycosyltransferase family 4 protein [Granulosicoccus sp.]